MKNLLFLALVLLTNNCPNNNITSPTTESEPVPPATTETSTDETTPNSDLCLNPEELSLYKMIMAYRAEKGLSSIPVSASLSLVAKSHVEDLQNNQPAQGRCNLHSWSKTENFGKCCYTDDHANAKCMWDKPRELTKYPGDGYEIAHWNSSNATAQSAFTGWKKSSGHNAVMINRSIWKNANWQAIGIGIYGGYAVVWFGKEKDPAGTLEACG